MPLLFAVALFVGAALLFVVQPMLAKSVLPLLGGAPTVWSTCQAFFQAALLAGYAYAHATARLGARRQMVLHALLLGIAWFAVPLTLSDAWGEPPEARPTGWLLAALLAGAGVPVVLCAATAPLLQHGFASTRHVSARDPYFLYGASNLGSLLALLAYPLAIEPSLRLTRQAASWNAGLGVLTILMLACAVVVWTAPRAVVNVEEPADGPRVRELAGWVTLAFLPTCWLLALTTYLSTDVAPIPLLWVIPLALYLLTFIIAFARRPWLPPWLPVRVLPIGAMALALVLGLGLVQPFWVPLHLFTFVGGALVCHQALARSRPSARHLTGFYLAVALGGVLGGAFNAFVAPALFDRLAEYPLALVLTCLVLPRSERWPRPMLWATLAIPLVILVLMAGLIRDVVGVATAPGTAAAVLASGLVVFAAVRHRRAPVRFALALGAALLASGLSDGVSGATLLRERNFFGTLRVTRVSDPTGTYHRLFHGNTLHGQQCLDPARRREPLSYFHPTGPIGPVFEPPRPRVAIVGLGAGALAAYARPEERWTFYELDPAVARVARDPRYFTFLADSRAETLDVVLGDARRKLRAAPAHGLDLIVLDAFSSDAVPTHLLTREALQLYRDKGSDRGLIVFNITNRYLDLEPVLAALARDAGLLCKVRADVPIDPAARRAGKQASIWAVMAAADADLGPLAADPRWRPARSAPDAAVWTDDYANLVGRLVFWGRGIHHKGTKDAKK